MRLIAIYTFLFISQFVFAQTQKMQTFYVGTFTSEGGSGIIQCGFNSETGEIKQLNIFKGIDNPSFLKLSPNKKYLYAGTSASENIEATGGNVNAYKIAENGTISFLTKQPSNGVEPCHVDVSADGKWVAAANYGSGSVSLFPVASGGELLSANSVIISRGSGADKERQNSPHAHSVKFSPFSESIFSADLGTDQLNIFTIENGKLVPGQQRSVKTEAGAGPRHFDFHPSGIIIYVINELNSTITQFDLNNDGWKRTESVSTLPSNFKGESYCADIHISANAQFLYASNRGHNSIAVFDIMGGGELNLRTTVGVEGNWPRNFALSPDGRFMLVANQRSGNITVFSIDEITGIPKFTGHEFKTKSPVCIEFVD